MARSLAADLSDVPRRPDFPADTRGERLRDHDHRTLVLRDSHFRTRADAPHPAGEDLRPVPLLARLLEPVAGERSLAVAERLIERFGTIGRALSASREQLGKLDLEDRIVWDKLVAARMLYETALAEDIASSPVDSSDPALIRYLCNLLGRIEEERVHAIFVDSHSCFIRDECVALGSTNIVHTSFRHLFRRAMDLGAEGIMLAHNHPSGCPQPSPADIEATRDMVAIARKLDLSILDHLIVAGHQVFSMKKARLL